MDKHLSICAAKEGITYSFDNSQIIHYQDNYKYMEDLPFSVYFDFETTAGNAVFFGLQMYVMSYCMIISFNKALNFDKIVIFRSYQQTSIEPYDISHFKQEHVAFFDQVTLRQLKDAASAVAFREKSTSLAEMFCIELKFTIDTLKFWFNKIIKPRSFEVDYNQKDRFEKDNLITKENLCSICDFPINLHSDNGWLEHAAKPEHLFLRNIYDQYQMKTMKIDGFNDYSNRIYRLLNIFEDFEDALQCGMTKSTSLAEMFCIELKFMSKFLISSGKICVKFTKHLIALERTLKRFLFLKNLKQKKKSLKKNL